MFGYIVANFSTLDADSKNRYRAAYCGLCRRLRLDYGGTGRSELSYDMTFASLLLSSAYGLKEELGEEWCPMKPVRRHPYIETEATAYAAGMNVLLAFHKRMDDWHDDGNRWALSKARALEARLERVRSRWPKQCEAVGACLKAIGEMERANELNPDMPANCFGELMAHVLGWAPDAPEAAHSSAASGKEATQAGREATQACRAATQEGIAAAQAGKEATQAGLWRIGAALGRFVYLMDACVDLKNDIKKERYNPLVAQPHTDFEPTLSMIIAECARELESLISGEAALAQEPRFAGNGNQAQEPRLAGKGNQAQEPRLAGKGNQAQEPRFAGEAALAQEPRFAGNGALAPWALPTAQDKAILRNVIYSGVWTRYRMRSAAAAIDSFRKRPKRKPSDNE